MLITGSLITGRVVAVTGNLSIAIGRGVRSSFNESRYLETNLSQAIARCGGGSGGYRDIVN